MSSSPSHVLALPKAMFALRIVQLVTTVVIMGLAAYGITFLSFDGIDLTMFTAIATIIITVYIILAETCAPVIYNYWAILGLDIFAIIFWIISFAYLASEVASYEIVTYRTSTCAHYYYGYCYNRKRDMDLAKRATTNIYTYRNSMAAASGLGGLEFVLFVVTLVFTSIYLHRHRKAGGHCMPGSEGPTSVEAGYGAPSFTATAVEPKESEMAESHPIQQMPPQQQQHYQQQVYSQPAEPMQAAAPVQGQGYAGQPAYA